MQNQSEQINEIATALAKARGVAWWAPPEFPGYMVSECGEVLSVRSGRPKMLKPIRMGHYLGVQLCNGGQITRRYIHRLVLESFCGSPRIDQECRHLDGDETNNDLHNLRWGTRAENHDDKRRHGTTAVGERNPQAKLTAATVAEMRRLRAATGQSYRIIAEQFGISTMTAYRAIVRQSWNC